MLSDLSSNNFSGQIPNELMALRELISLNLSRNQLTGNIPDKIGDMKALESFDLSLNKLSGELPMSLSKLTFISIFNVSYNNFKGRVPTSTQIQSLDESNFIGNKLCGAPLTSDCVPVDVPVIAGDQEKEDGSHGEDWGLIISIVLGFITGFWIVVASLIVNKSWRIVYFRLWGKWIKV
ncbi:putative non-specific serine/threonine protein kinase [Helianthus annuus]|nr:putative non-specific serine/threonine protein kinase [Helianthus annuus]